jgi:hypothetical protein
MFTAGPAKLLPLLQDPLVGLDLRPDQDLGLEALRKALVQGLLLEAPRWRHRLVVFGRLRAEKKSKNLLKTPEGSF